MRSINEIIIHCTDNRQDSKITVADIRKDHLKRGWSDIGYHYVIYANGKIERGRPVTRKGAHCSVNGHNRHSIGIAYIGGRNLQGQLADTRTDAQVKAMHELCSHLLKTYPGITRIVGHRDYDSRKECPCFDAIPEFQYLL